MVMPLLCRPGRLGLDSCAFVETCAGGHRDQVLKNQGAKRMKKSLVTLLLVLAIGALVQQAAAQAAGQAAPAQKQIKDPAEYNAYVNAIQQTTPAAKAQALEAFAQTYPNSVMKED